MEVDLQSHAQNRLMGLLFVVSLVKMFDSATKNTVEAKLLGDGDPEEHHRVGTPPGQKPSLLRPSGVPSISTRRDQRVSVS